MLLRRASRQPFPVKLMELLTLEQKQTLSNPMAMSYKYRDAFEFAFGSGCKVVFGRGLWPNPQSSLISVSGIQVEDDVRRRS